MPCNWYSIKNNRQGYYWKDGDKVLFSKKRTVKNDGNNESTLTILERKYNFCIEKGLKRNREAMHSE
jgi:hypothetical protein